MFECLPIIDHEIKLHEFIVGELTVAVGVAGFDQFVRALAREA